MAENPKIYVVDMGMVTPVGANTEMTSSSVRAGISGYQEVDFYDEDFNKIRMSVVPSELLEDNLVGELLTENIVPRHARMLQLAKLALLQIVEQVPNDHAIPLFLAGPQSLNTDDQPLDKSFIKNLSIQCGVEFDISVSRIVSTGRSAGIEVVELAMKYMDVSDSDYVIVGGVDTFYDKNIIDFYLLKERLLTYKSVDGFIPGEGAVFLLLMKGDTELNDSNPLPYITEPGVGYENGNMYSDEPYIGDGLAQAVAISISNADTPNIMTVYSSMNGENYFAKELGVAIIRNKKYFADNYEMKHPADCFGDLGAAIGLVMIALVSFTIKHGYNQPPCLVYCSSDTGYRSATIVSV